VRRLSAWVILAVLTAGCGLNIGIEAPDDADGADRAVIRLAAETNHGPGAILPSDSTERGDATSAAPETIGGGGPSPGPDDPPESTRSEPEATGTTTPGTASTAPPSASEPTTSTTVDLPTTTTGASSPTTEVEVEATEFSEDEAFVTHRCDGNGLAISGDAGDYTLEGSCGTVTITGSFNAVFIDEVDSIELTGTFNAVIYGSGDPVINDLDGDNIVTEG
jgi:hypothetical protein